MKQFFTAILFLPLFMYAQPPLITLLQKKDLVEGSDTVKLNKSLSKYQLFKLSAPQKLPGNMRLSIPGNQNSPVILDLEKQELRAPGFKIRTSTGHEISNYEYGDHYAGHVTVNSHSVAAFSFVHNRMKGFFSDKSGNNLILPLKENKSGLHVLYNDTDLIYKERFECAAPDTMPAESYGTQGAQGTSGTCKFVKMYVECDYSMYQAFNQKTDSLITFVFELFNTSAAIFKNDGINIKLSEIFIWTGPDGYIQDVNAVSVLRDFEKRLLEQRQAGASLNADVVHLLSTRELGGGVSNRIGMDVNCLRDGSSFTAAVSGLIRPFPQPPAYSGTIFLFTHETGHTLGSPHTHNCGWQGGPIDNCFTPEGICSPGPAPVNGGTIMSYCQSSPGGVNFSNGFGPQPSRLIRYEIERRNCLSSCADTICGYNRVGIMEVSLTDTVFRIKWENLYSKYRIGVFFNTTKRWTYYETTADTLVLSKDKCVQKILYSVAAFCQQQNRFGTAYFYTVSNTSAPEANYVYPNPQQSTCAGTFIQLYAAPVTGALYHWYRNGVLQPQYIADTILAYPAAKYNFVMEKNGCSYFSDTVSIAKQGTPVSFSFRQSGLNVTFSQNNNCLDSVQWDFGDGVGSSGFSTQHQYQKEGVYKVIQRLWGTEGEITPAVVRYIMVYNALTDTLDKRTAGTADNVSFRDTLCRQAAWFGSDSLEILKPAQGGRQLAYSQLQQDTVLFRIPPSGTIEIKIRPISGLIKKFDAPVQVSDTGYVFNQFAQSAKELNRFYLYFTKWGGLRLMVNGIALGNIQPGVTGPLAMNQWNHVGFSIGNKGIKLIVNGVMYDSTLQSIDPSLFSMLTIFLGTYLSNESDAIYAPRYHKGFLGAVDMVRFSQNQNDFTFSSAAPWQGRDTVVIRKMICAGLKYEGYGESGIYYRNNITGTGCDSITRIELTVNKPLEITASVTHPTDGKKGALLITGLTGAAGPVKYSWNTGDTTSSLINLTEGKYTVTVTDSMHCTLVKEFILFSFNTGKDRAVLFPNPVAGKEHIYVRLGSVNGGPFTFVMHDAAGRKMYQQYVNAPAGVSEWQLKHPWITPGIYSVTVSSNKGKQALKVIVY